MKDKIADISYISLVEGNIIKLTTDGKRLIETAHCDHLIIWYNCNASEATVSMQIYAIEEVENTKNLTKGVKKWHDTVAITEALSYISEKLI